MFSNINAAKSLFLFTLLYLAIFFFNLLNDFFPPMLCAATSKIMDTSFLLIGLYVMPDSNRIYFELMFIPPICGLTIKYLSTASLDWTRPVNLVQKSILCDILYHFLTFLQSIWYEFQAVAYRSIEAEVSSASQMEGKMLFISPIISYLNQWKSIIGSMSSTTTVDTEPQNP